MQIEKCCYFFTFFVSTTRKQPGGSMKQILYRCTVILYKFILLHDKAYFINCTAPVEQFSVVVHKPRQHLDIGP